MSASRIHSPFSSRTIVRQDDEQKAMRSPSVAKLIGNSMKFSSQPAGDQIAASGLNWKLYTVVPPTATIKSPLIVRSQPKLPLLFAGAGTTDSNCQVAPAEAERKMRTSPAPPAAPGKPTAIA